MRGLGNNGGGNGVVVGTARIFVVVVVAVAVVVVPQLPQQVKDIHILIVSKLDHG